MENFNITFIDNLVNNRNELNNYSNFMLFHTKKISNIIEYNLCVFYNFNISIFSLLYKIRILVNNNEFTSILSNFTINKSYLMEFIKERKINLEDLYNPGRTQEINLLSNKLSLDNINYIIDFLLPNHNDLQIIINNNISIKRQSVQKPLYYKSNDFFDRFFGL